MAVKPNIDLTLYVVTDRGLSRGKSTIEVVAKALEGGATVIQYREKVLPFGRMLEECLAIKPMIAHYGATFIINDRVDLMMACEADGVHLGREDMPIRVARRLLGPEKIIGASVQTPAEAQAAAEAGADYLGVSGVFFTSTKTDVGAILGLEMVTAIAETVKLSIVGIGGINERNAAEVIRAGAQGIAVVSAVVSAEDIASACRNLMAAVLEGRRG